MKKLFFFITTLMLLTTSCCTDCGTNSESKTRVCQITQEETLYLKENINDGWINIIIYVDKFDYDGHSYLCINNASFIHDPNCGCTHKIEYINKPETVVEKDSLTDWWLE